MLYNKLEGLELLSKRLKGLEHTSVLPWRVYHSAEEFKPSHFRNAKRLLIRTNFKYTEIPYIVWQIIPRSEWDKSSPVSAKQTLSQLAYEWTCWRRPPIRFKELGEVDDARFHFIVHGVLPREEYRANIKLEAEPGAEPIVSVASTSSRLWRSEENHSIPVPASDLESVEKALKYIGFRSKEAAELSERIKKACDALKGNGYERWEASASVTKKQPTHLEFYDFLHTDRRISIA